jgi:hypothetical protein
MLTKAKVVAASRMKMRQVKVPAARFFNVGESEQVAAWHRYYHQLAVHLESASQFFAVYLFFHQGSDSVLTCNGDIHRMHTQAYACPLPSSTTPAPLALLRHQLVLHLPKLSLAAS